MYRADRLDVLYAAFLEQTDTGRWVVLDGGSDVDGWLSANFDCPVLTSWRPLPGVPRGHRLWWAVVYVGYLHAEWSSDHVHLVERTARLRLKTRPREYSVTLSTVFPATIILQQTTQSSGGFKGGGAVGAVAPYWLRICTTSFPV